MNSLTGGFYFINQELEIGDWNQNHLKFLILLSLLFIILLYILFVQLCSTRNLAKKNAFRAKESYNIIE